MTLRRLLRVLLRVGVFCFGVLAIYVFVTFVQVFNASNQAHQDPAQAIIVLGAAQYDGTPSPVLAGRLEHAIELYEAGVATTVVVTGGKQPGDRFTEAAASFRYLRDAGIPEERILREEQGSNTWEQLAAATRELRERGMRSAVLVSDDYHAYRLDEIADELGLDAQVSPVDPGLSFGGASRAMAKETVAVAVGRVIGFRRLVNLDDQLSLSVPDLPVG